MRVCRWALVAIVLVASGCATQIPVKVPEDSFRRACEQRLQAGTVRVTTAVVRPEIDESLSFGELTRIAERDDATWVLGLTRPTLRVDVRWRFAELADPRGGRSCIRPSLEMTLRYVPVVVYVAREFAHDRCSREFILEHERRHVAVHSRRLGIVAAELERDLRAEFAGTTWIGESAELRRRLNQAVRGIWIPRAEKALKDVRAEHAAIDSPDEYARAKTACDGRIFRMLPARSAGIPRPR